MYTGRLTQSRLRRRWLWPESRGRVLQREKEDGTEIELRRTLRTNPAPFAFTPSAVLRRRTQTSLTHY